MTNFEKIKQMTAEQVADLIFTIADCCYKYGCNDGGCNECPLNGRPCYRSIDILKWLESEVDTE